MSHQAFVRAMRGECELPELQPAPSARDASLAQLAISAIPAIERANSFTSSMAWKVASTRVDRGLRPLAFIDSS